MPHLPEMPLPYRRNHRDPATESVPPFPHHESDCKQSQAQKDISSKRLQTAHIPPWKHDRKSAPPEIHASRPLPSHHQSSLHPLPFCRNAAYLSAHSRPLPSAPQKPLPVLGNPLLPHALPPEPPMDRSCRFLSDSHIHPFSDLSTERKIPKADTLPMRSPLRYPRRFPCTMPPHWQTPPLFWLIPLPSFPAALS